MDNETRTPLYFIRAENDNRVIVVYTQMENIHECYELVRTQLFNTNNPEYTIGFFEDVYTLNEILPSSKIKITDLYMLEYAIRNEEPTDNINDIDTYFYDGISIKSVIL